MDKTQENTSETLAKQNGIVLACSGASDIGELADRVARKIRELSDVKMKCLAMVGAEDTDLISSLQTAETLVIDGCEIDCGKKIMEEAWLTNYRYIRLTDLGYVKGQTKVTEDLVSELANKIIHSDNINKISGDRRVKKGCCTEETC